ncbi:MAG: class I SAM-dependent methyltransferase [Candidatus Dadabacteria bacterium]|nr:MAG: class I SAM-dependent methyltransferase [Candidatus Dadabacteria bacterium]
MKQQDWYRRSFGKEYLKIYAHRNLELAEEEVDFVVKTLNLDSSAAVLDFACGAGRHLYHFYRRNVKVIGADLSEELLVAARTLVPEARLVRHDMRYLPFASESFEAVLSLFTSFGYFESDNENLEVLKGAYRVLKNGGRILIDFMNAPLAVNSLVKSSSRKIDGAEIIEKRSYNRQTGRIEKEMELYREDGTLERYFESVRAYTPAELRELLSMSRFKITGEFGDFRGSSYCNDSERYIVMAST